MFLRIYKSTETDKIHFVELWLQDEIILIVGEIPLVCFEHITITDIKL